MKSLSSIDSYISCATDFQETYRGGFPYSPAGNLAQQQEQSHHRFSHSPAANKRPPCLQTPREHHHHEPALLTPPCPSSIRPPGTEGIRYLGKAGHRVRYYSGTGGGGAPGPGGGGGGVESSPASGGGGPQSDSSVLSDRSLLSPEASVYTTASSTRSPPEGPDGARPGPGPGGPAPAVFTFHDASISRYIDADTDDEEHRPTDRLLAAGTGGGAGGGGTTSKLVYSSLGGTNHLDAAQRLLGQGQNCLLLPEGRQGNSNSSQENHLGSDQLRRARGIRSGRAQTYADNH